jgi:endonuclease III
VRSQKQRAQQAARLVRQAVAKYGELKGRKVRPPLNQLVLSMMAHETSVRQATRALRALKRRFADWNEVRVSHPAEVGAAISSAKWAQEAAERLVWMLGEIFEAYNRANLDFLNELTHTQARSCLVRLPMVRRDIADEVLLFSLGAAVLPLSDATARMCHRLGLIDDDRPTLKNQRALAKLFEERYYPSLHLFFCDHAEKLCRADDALCQRCPTQRHCPKRQR